jgi:hypothetical protein
MTGGSVAWRAGWLAAGLLAAGCASTALKPGGTVTLTVDAAKKQDTVAVPLTHVIELTLPAAAPGLAWQIALHDPRYLKQQTEFVPSKTPGGGPTISFIALALGSTRLRFLLTPVNGGGGVEPLADLELLVRIQ